MIASFFDAVWFLTLGYIAGATVGNVADMPVTTRIFGGVIGLAIIGLFIGRGGKCAIRPASPRAATK